MKEELTLFRKTGECMPKGLTPLSYEGATSIDKFEKRFIILHEALREGSK
jgi:hypothetical protein